MTSRTKGSSNKENTASLAKPDQMDLETVSVSLKDLESIVDKIIKKHFEDYKVEMKALFEGHLERIEARITDIEADLGEKSEKLIQLESQFGKFVSLSPNDENLVSPQELEEVKKLARKATVMANDCEQYSHRNNVRIRGLQFPEDTNYVDSVADWINTRLNLSDITAEDIRAAHPIPMKFKNPKSTANTGSTFLVRFKDKKVRNAVISSRKVLKKSEFSIVDDLTSLNAQLLNRLKNSELITDTWSWQSKIFAKLPNGKIVVARPYQIVDDLYKL